MFAMVFKCFQMFLQVCVSDACSVLSVFFCMSQVLYLDVSKVDQVLHIGCAWEAGGVRAIRARSLVAWATSRAARAHCWGARSLAARTPSDASAPDRP
jgi:hypothetical protein